MRISLLHGVRIGCMAAVVAVVCPRAPGHAQDLGELGAHVKRTMNRLWQGAEPAERAPSAPAVGGKSTMYRYVDRKGRTVYTNVEEQVPVEQRVAAKLDLSDVSLHEQLGGELDRRLEEEHTALTKSPYCRQLREAADANFVLQMWTKFPGPMICGGALLVLLLFTPSACRRFGAPDWAKVLMMAIPMLASIGLLSFTTAKTRAVVAVLKHNAMPCSEEAFASLSSATHPVQKHAELLQQLKRQMHQIAAESR